MAAPIGPVRLYRSKYGSQSAPVAPPSTSPAPVRYYKPKYASPLAPRVPPPPSLPQTPEEALASRTWGETAVDTGIRAARQAGGLAQAGLSIFGAPEDLAAPEPVGTSPGEILASGARAGLETVSGIGIPRIARAANAALGSGLDTLGEYASPGRRRADELFAQIDAEEKSALPATEASAPVPASSGRFGPHQGVVYDPAAVARSAQRAEQEAKLTFRKIGADPAGMVGDIAGNALPFMAAGRLGRAAGIAEEVMAPAFSVPLEAGSVKQNIAQTVMGEPHENLMSDPRYAAEVEVFGKEVARKRLADRAQSYLENPGLIALGAAEGYILSKAGADAALMRAGSGAVKEGITRGVLKNTLREGAKEFATELPQEMFTTAAGNIGAASGGANIDPMKGVVESGIMAGFTAGPAGAVAGAVDAFKSARAGAENAGQASAPAGAPLADDEFTQTAAPAGQEPLRRGAEPVQSRGDEPFGAPIAPARRPRPAFDPTSAQIVLEAEILGGDGLKALMDTGMSKARAESELKRVRAVLGPKAPTAKGVDRAEDKKAERRRAEAEAAGRPSPADEIASFDADPLANAPRRREATPEEVAAYLEDAQRGIMTAEEEAAQTARLRAERDRRGNEVVDETYAPLLEANREARTAAERAFDDQTMRPAMEEARAARGAREEIASRGGPAFRLPPLMAAAVAADSIKPLVDAGVPGSPSQLRKMLEKAKSASAEANRQEQSTGPDSGLDREPQIVRESSPSPVPGIAFSGDLGQFGEVGQEAQRVAERVNPVGRAEETLPAVEAGPQVERPARVVAEDGGDSGEVHGESVRLLYDEIAARVEEIKRAEPNLPHRVIAQRVNQEFGTDNRLGRGREALGRRIVDEILKGQENPKTTDRGNYPGGPVSAMLNSRKDTGIENDPERALYEAMDRQDRQQQHIAESVAAKVQKDAANLAEQEALTKRLEESVRNTRREGVQREPAVAPTNQERGGKNLPATDRTNDVLIRKPEAGEDAKFAGGESGIGSLVADEAPKAVEAHAGSVPPKAEIQEAATSETPEAEFRRTQAEASAAEDRWRHISTSTAREIEGRTPDEKRANFTKKLSDAKRAMDEAKTRAQKATAKMMASKEQGVATVPVERPKEALSSLSGPIEKTGIGRIDETHARRRVRILVSEIKRNSNDPARSRSVQFAYDELRGHLSDLKAQGDLDEPTLSVVRDSGLYDGAEMAKYEPKPKGITPEEGLAKSIAKLDAAIDALDVKALQNMLHPGNPNLRAHFTKKTGISLPKGYQATTDKLAKIGATKEGIAAGKSPEAAYTEAFAAKAEEPSGAFKVGQKLKMMSSDVTVKARKVVDGIEYSILREDGGPAGFVRVKDLDSGNVITLKKHPTFAGARNEYLIALKTLKPKTPRSVTIKEAEITPTLGGVVATPTRVETVKGSDIGESTDLTPEDLARMDEHDRQWLARLIESGDIPKDLDARRVWANRQWGGNVPAQWLKKYGLATESTMVPEEGQNDPTAQANPDTLDYKMAEGQPLRGASLAPEEGEPAGDRPANDGDVRGERGRPDVVDDEGQDVGDAGRSPRVQHPAPRDVGRGGIPVSADFRPEPGGLKREGSWFDTAARNVDLIELAIEIEKAGRAATPEEQARLSKYVGFGASEIRNKLFPVPNDYSRRNEPDRLIWPSLVYDAKWRPLAERMDALPRDWQKSVLQSTQYAHYTSEGIVRSMWKAMERLGFTGGRVLEPGSGIGSFPMLMPDSMRAPGAYTGYEFDGPTALIARLLSPAQNMLHADFIKRKLPRDFFDVAIGNPPFSQTKILADPEYSKYGFMLHDYFFAKSIDRVRPGGLLVFVTSKGTMDKQSDKARKYLSERADLLGAIRLPNVAFQENAGTGVVTDVIFLRKRAKGEAPSGPAWAGHKTVETKDGPVVINEYFADNPEMVLGQNRISGNRDDNDRYIASTGMGGNQYTVVSYDTTPEELDAKFSAAVEKLPPNVYSVIDSSTDTIRAETEKMDFDPKVKREGVIYQAEDGALMRVSNGIGEPLSKAFPGKLNPKDVAWFKSYVGLRDLVRAAQKAQVEEGDWESALKALNKAHDAFRKAHGPILDYRIQTRKETDEDGNVTETPIRIFKNKRLWREDYDNSIITALETITEAGDIVKGPFLKGRTIGKPVPRDIKTIGDALSTSLDELGRLDMKDVASRLKITEEEAIEALGDSVYRDPSAGWQTSDEYLSGDVVTKLSEAEEAARHDSSLERNVKALRDAQPERLGPSKISVPLGASWVPDKYISEFAQEIGAGGGVSFINKGESWHVPSAEGTGKRSRRSASSEYGTADRSPAEILELILNSKPITIKVTDKDRKTYTDEKATEAARNAAKKIQAKFASWIWSDSDRTTDLVNLYNERFNNIAGRKYNGDHLTLPGVSLRFKLHPHQLRAIWRQIVSGNTYLAHAVGAGKTIEMIAGGMEQKRLGLIKKPIYVVPNHMLEQFANEFMELYPLANIMVADDANFTGDRRRAFIAAAAMNSPDAVVITASAFQKIGVKEESVKPIRDEILQELQDELDDSEGDRVKRSRLQQQIEAAEQYFDKIVSSHGKDSAVSFEDMGIDMIYADEAHQYRKLDFATNQKVKGIDPVGSGISMGMYIKTRILEKMNPGRSLVFASGTPVTNTMGELYTLSRFFQGEQMKKDGISSFDAWARTFGSVVADLERNAAGNYETVTRFAEFQNIPELMSRVREFMDVLTSEHLGALVKRPDIKGGKPDLILVDMLPAARAYMDNVLAPRLARSKKWKPSRSQPFNPDPIVKIINDGRLVALDPRFVGAHGITDQTPTKLNKMAEEIAAEYKATAGNKYTGMDGEPEATPGSTQIVFYNMGFGEGVKASSGFDARLALTRGLVSRGVKREHIAWFADADTDAKKEAVFKAMRSGQVRVLIGSAKQMGTGVNVQKRLSKLHYFDPPWYPADVEQPHGRILRQGNQNPEVGINWYATKGGYDSTMWQMVARKQKFIDQAFTGDKNLRKMTDLGEQSMYAQAAALASGDPRALQLAGLEQDVNRLELARAAHFDQQNKLHGEIRDREWALHSHERVIKRMSMLMEEIGDEYLSFEPSVVGGKEYRKSTEFGEALKEAYNAKITEMKAEPTRAETQLGKLGKFPVVVSQNWQGDSPLSTFSLEMKVGPGKGQDNYMTVHPGSGLYGDDVDPGGLVRRMLNILNGVSSDLNRAKASATEDKTTIARLQKKLGVPFDGEQDLAEKFGELKALQDSLRAEGVAAASAPESQAPTAIDADGNIVSADSQVESEEGEERSREVGPDEPSREEEAAAEEEPAEPETDPEENGLPLSDRKAKKGTFLKATVKDGKLLAGAFEGRQYHSNGNWLVEGDAPKSRGEATKDESVGRLFARVLNPDKKNGPGPAVTPVAYFKQPDTIKNKGHEIIVFSDGQTIRGDFYDYVLSKDPNVQAFTLGGDKGVYFKAEDGHTVGVVMPIRADLPPGAAALLPKAEQKKKGKKPKFSRPGNTEEMVWENYNGRSDSGRGETTLEAYKNGIQVNGAAPGIRVVDFEGDVEKSVLGEMARASAALAARIAPAVRMIQAHVPMLKFGGFAPAGNLHGVQVSGMVFVNQLATHQIAVTAAEEQGITYHEAFARAMTDVLIHEAAHYAERGHGDAFLAELERIREALGPVALRAIRRDLMKYASDNKNRTQNARMYEKALPGWREGERRGREAAAAVQRGDVRGRPDVPERLYPRPRSDTGDAEGAGVEGDGSQGSLFAPDGNAAEGLGAPAFVRGTDGRVAPGDPRRDENFRRWFGDSKVVDENGKPLVVYHGTRRGFTTFKPASAEAYGRGIYFSDVPSDTEEFTDDTGGNIIPAYVKIENPWDGTDPGYDEIEKTKAWKRRANQTDMEPDDLFDEDGSFLNDVIRELGYDGIIVRSAHVQDGREIVAFEPEQVKSATGNRGTFDPKNPDIRFSRKPPAPPEKLSVAAEGVLNDLAKRIRDVFTPVKVAQEAVEKKLGKRWDVRLDRQLTGIPARADHTMGQAESLFLNPLMEIVRTKGLDFDLAGEYAQARYDVGMDEKKRAAILAKAKNPAYEEVRKRILDVQRISDDYKVKMGLATAGDIADLRDIRGADYVSTKEHPLIAAIQDLEKTVIQAERNRTLNDMAEFVEAAGEPALGSVSEGFEDGGVHFRRDGEPMTINLPDKGLRAALDGLSDTQLDNLTQTVGALTRWTSRVNTQLSPVFPIRNTGRDWGGAILFGSILHGAPKGISKSVAWEVMKNEARAMRGVIDYLKAPEKKHPDGSWAAKVAEASRYGAVPGYLKQMSSIGKIRSQLEEALKSKLPVREHLKVNAAEARATLGDKSLDSLGKAAKIASLGTDAASRAIGFRAFSDFMGWLSNVSEMATRANYHAALVKNGMSPRAAADETRDLIDFNRKGSWTRNMQAFLPFINPNIQGTARILDMVASKDPAVKSRAVKTITALTAAGFAYGMAMAALGGDEDKDGIPDMDQLPDFQSSRNVALPAVGNLAPILLPLPPGFNVPFFAGFMASKIARGTIKPGKAIASIATQFAEAFTPIDSPFGVFKPLGEIAVNKKFGGGPVSPTNFSEHRPDSTVAFKNTRTPYRAAAEGLNRLTGGDEVTKGLIDVSPDTLEHLGEALLGGTGRFFTRSADSIEALAKGQVPNYIPVYSDLTVDVERQRQARFYDQVRQIEETDFKRRGKEKSALIQELAARYPGVDFTRGTLPQLRKALQGQGVSPERREWFLKELERIDADALKAKPAFDAAEKALKEIEKTMKDGPEKDAARREVYLRANRAYQEATK